jgi:DNA-binding transcriptional MerR regulator
MAAVYSIGDLEKFLGVKAHVIRYWEKEIPFLQPRKDLGGRRVYGKRDLLVFFRLKHLLYDRRFTLEGAKEQLFREFSAERQDLSAQLQAIRADLLDLYFLVRSENSEPQ